MVSNWGGARKGAGRPRAVRVASSQLAEIEVEAALAADIPAEIDGVAQRYARTALDNLVRELRVGQSETARISAAAEILDRGYGKPAVEIGGDAAMPGLPFQAAPVTAPSIALSADIRAAARRFAVLAIETLHRIATAGVSATARVSANKALIARGLGTSAPARMPEELRNRPLGKKEEAQVAAQAAATGRYRTPTAPSGHTDRLQ